MTTTSEETALPMAVTRSDLIPSLPDHIVLDHIWPKVMNLDCQNPGDVVQALWTFNALSRKWRKLVKDCPYWYAFKCIKADYKEVRPYIPYDCQEVFRKLRLADFFKNARYFEMMLEQNLWKPKYAKYSVQQLREVRHWFEHFLGDIPQFYYTLPRGKAISRCHYPKPPIEL